MRTRVALLAVALLPLLTLAGDPAQEQAEMQEIYKRSKEAMDKARSEPMPEYLRRPVPEAFAEEARVEAERVKEIQRKAISKSGTDHGVDASELDGTALAEATTTNPDQGRIGIFVSTSMPESVLRDLLANSAREKVTVLIRGLIPGTQNVLETQKRLAELTKDVEQRPDILFNPVAFKDFNIQVVPTVIYAGAQKNTAALRVEGSFNLDYLDQELSNGKGEPLDLGRIGQVWDIAEEDLIVAMRRRFDSIDWESKADEARKRFWNNQTFVELPIAREDTSRTIDPTVVVTEDFVDPREKTRVIARAGERHNPLEKVPLTKRIIVFDARDPKQMHIVRELRSNPVQGKHDLFITTAIDRDRGWEQHSEISNELSSPLYLLNSDLKAMLRLKAIPSVIVADGTNLVIQEIRVPL